MTPATIRAHHQLRMARLGHALLDALPGAALVLADGDGRTVTVAGVGDPRGDVLPCQHRAALTRALAAGSAPAYASAVGLDPVDTVAVELLAPPGSDVGLGVFARDEAPDRRLLTVTTLCPGHAASAVRSARTVPLPAHQALTREPDLAELRLEVAHDGPLGVTLLSWLHRPHPSVVGPIEDVAHAAAAACAVAELLHELAPSMD